MKKFILIALIVPFFTKNSQAQFTLTNSSTVSLVELRSASDTWPLDLQRIIKQTDTSYALNFRDQQFANTVVMSTLKFKDKAQVKYFQQALSTLSTLGTGTTANFKGFSIKRADSLKDVQAAPPPPPAPVPTVAKKGAKGAKAAPTETAAVVPVKKGPSKVNAVWYLLTCEDGTLTNFQQSDADKMIAAIQPL